MWHQCFLTKISADYFDCNVNLRCDECEKVVWYPEPRKCQRNNKTEGNIIHVFHYLSEGYGQAGQSRLSALMGCKKIPTTYTFNCHAQFIYQQMNGFYKEQEKRKNYQDGKSDKEKHGWWKTSAN